MMLRVLAVCLPLFLLGCGTTSGLDNPFTDRSIQVLYDTIYVPEQSRQVEIVNTASYESGWESDPTLVTGPVLGELAGSTPSNLGQSLENGSITLPFNNGTLYWNYQNSNDSTYLDPNAWVKSMSGEIYDLSWGVVDGNGPSYVSNYVPGDGYTYQSSASETIWGLDLTGSLTSEGPRLSSPGFDALDAWGKGWTGAGINALVIDSVNGTSGDLSKDYQGVIVSRILQQFAPSAQILLKNSGTDDVFQLTAPALIDGEPSSLEGTNKVQIVNLSIAYDSSPLLNSTLVSTMRGSQGFKYTGIDLSDSVISVAAGDDTLNLVDTPNALPSYLVNDAVTQSRSLVVGAISVDSLTGTRDIASYSNRPGNDLILQSRFVLAPGSASWVDGYFAIQGTQISASATVGTGLAAPRVSAYAAIVRQKFPNLTSAQTANILVDTATTEGLACFPSCSPAIYGKGEVSLRRALAPVGQLR